MGEEEGELRRSRVELGRPRTPMGLGIFCHWSMMRNRVDNQIRQCEHIPNGSNSAVQFKLPMLLLPTQARLSHPRLIAKEDRNETVVKRSFDWVS